MSATLKHIVDNARPSVARECVMFDKRQVQVSIYLIISGFVFVVCSLRTIFGH